MRNHAHALEARRHPRKRADSLVTWACAQSAHVVRGAGQRWAEAERLEGQVVGEGYAHSRVIDQHHLDG